MKPSEQQRKILAFPYTKYDALICDGSIRAGKTCIMMWAFIDWAMREFDGKRFAICGKTIDSAVKNIVVPFMSMSLTKERYGVRWRRQDHILEVERCGHSNVFEIFGGKDESSYAFIQGRTLAGVLLDEVALMPRSFVEQALARCSEDGSRLWFNCNPDSAQHWFNVEWILKAKERNALHLHFTLDDNPGLSEKIRERYKSMYAGLFYQRYILGLWVMADGLVYDMFEADRHCGETETEGDYYVSCDYGIQNATVFLLWRREKGTQRWVCLNEYYYSGRQNQVQKTVDRHADGLVDMLGGIVPRAVIIDPSASALIVELRKRKYHVIKANNDVIDGISDVSTMLRQDRLLFDPKRCKHTVEEFGLYCWDKKAADRGEDKPIKDNDHCMDAVRYMVKTKNLVKAKKDYVPII